MKVICTSHTTNFTRGKVYDVLEEDTFYISGRPYYSILNDINLIEAVYTIHFKPLRDISLDYLLQDDQGYSLE